MWSRQMGIMHPGYSMILQFRSLFSIRTAISDGYWLWRGTCAVAHKKQLSQRRAPRFLPKAFSVLFPWSQYKNIRNCKEMWNLLHEMSRQGDQKWFLEESVFSIFAFAVQFSGKDRHLLCVAPRIFFDMNELFLNLDWAHEPLPFPSSGWKCTHN